MDRRTEHGRFDTGGDGERGGAGESGGGRNVGKVQEQQQLSNRFEKKLTLNKDMLYYATNLDGCNLYIFKFQFRQPYL